jgi:RNA polymerase sigma-70 factor, ECF subfamily
VARLLAAMLPPLVRIGGGVERHEVNGQPGAIFTDRDGNVICTWAIDIRDGRVETIRAVMNPDKLAHLGPVADAWAVYREASLSRRPGA